MIRKPSVTPDMLRAALVGLRGFVDSHQLIVRLKRMFPDEFAEDRARFEGSIDPERAHHASIARRYLKILAKHGGKIRSTSVRGNQTLNQQWQCP